MLQLALTVSIYLLIVIPAGVYLYHIAAGKHTFADPVFDRVDGAIYKISGVDPGKGMNWKQYALALLGTNAVMVFIGYLILRVQSAGLFNPNNIENMEPTLAFNTIISFMTNTNLQHYCCFSERMRKLFRKNEKNVLRFCNKKAKEKRRLQRVKKPM